MLSIIFIVFWINSNMLLKLADLCTCTLRRNGSMVFKASALRILMIFSFPCCFSLRFGIVSRSHFGSFGDLPLELGGSRGD